MLSLGSAGGGGWLESSPVVVPSPVELELELIWFPFPFPGLSISPWASGELGGMDFLLVALARSAEKNLSVRDGSVDGGREEEEEDGWSVSPVAAGPVGFFLFLLLLLLATPPKPKPKPPCSTPSKIPSQAASSGLVGAGG